MNAYVPRFNTHRKIFPHVINFFAKTYAHRLPGPTPWPFIGTAPLLISHLDDHMVFFFNDLYRKVRASFFAIKKRSLLFISF